MLSGLSSRIYNKNSKRPYIQDQSSVACGWAGVVIIKKPNILLHQNEIPTSKEPTYLHSLLFSLYQVWIYVILFLLLHRKLPSTYWLFSIAIWNNFVNHLLKKRYHFLQKVGWSRSTREEKKSKHALLTFSILKAEKKDPIVATLE